MLMVFAVLIRGNQGSWGDRGPDLVFHFEPIMGWKVESPTRDQGLPGVTDMTASVRTLRSWIWPALLSPGPRVTRVRWAVSVACVHFCRLQCCLLGRLCEAHSSASSGPTWAVSGSVLLKASLVKLAAFELFGNTLQSLWGLLHQPRQVFPQRSYYSQ